MRIATEILDKFPELNESQREIVGHIEGPLLVVAGPGSGKTYCLVLRTLNLLLLKEAQPRQVVLCTFTEKAALEMRHRRRIQACEFHIKTPPEPKICKECDLRTLCRTEGIIQ